MKASLILMGLLSLASQAHADIQCVAPGLAGSTKIEISGRLNNFGNQNEKLQLIATSAGTIATYSINVTDSNTPLFDESDKIQINGTTENATPVHISIAGFYACGALIASGDGVITLNNIPTVLHGCKGDLF